MVNFLLISHVRYVLGDKDEAGRRIKTFKAVIDQEFLLHLLGLVICLGKFGIFFDPRAYQSIVMHSDFSGEFLEGRQVLGNELILCFLLNRSVGFGYALFLLNNPLVFRNIKKGYQVFAVFLVVFGRSSGHIS